MKRAHDDNFNEPRKRTKNDANIERKEADQTESTEKEDLKPLNQGWSIECCHSSRHIKEFIVTFRSYPEGRS